MRMNRFRKVSLTRSLLRADCNPQNNDDGDNHLQTNLVPRLFHLTAPAPEERPWFRLVTCLPKSGRLSKQKLGEGRLSRKFAKPCVLGSGNFWRENKHFSHVAQYEVRFNLGGQMSHTVTPKKVYAAYKKSSRCRLCSSVGDHRKNLFGKANRALLRAAEELCGSSLPQREDLPHLICRPCERRLNAFARQYSRSCPPWSSLILIGTRLQRL